MGIWGEDYFIRPYTYTRLYTYLFVPIFLVKKNKFSPNQLSECWYLSNRAKLLCLFKFTLLII